MTTDPQAVHIKISDEVVGITIPTPTRSLLLESRDFTEMLGCMLEIRDGSSITASLEADATVQFWTDEARQAFRTRDEWMIWYGEIIGSLRRINGLVTSGP